MSEQESESEMIAGEGEGGSERATERQSEKGERGRDGGQERKMERARRERERGRKLHVNPALCRRRLDEILALF